MRRRFFLLAAPAIVAAPSLMKISALVMPETGLVRAHLEEDWAEISASTFGDLITATLRNRTAKLLANMEKDNAILRAIRDGRIDSGEIRVTTHLRGENA